FLYLPARSTMVPRTGEVRPRPLSARASEESPAVRLLSLWRRTARLYRQHLCDDGDDAGRGNSPSTAEARTGRRTGGGPAGGPEVRASQGRGAGSLDPARYGRPAGNFGVPHAKAAVPAAPAARSRSRSDGSEVGSRRCSPLGIMDPRRGSL